jgi:hypothetical protein
LPSGYWGTDFERGDAYVKIPESLLRHHTQWFMINRAHADLVAYDEDLYGRFDLVCRY